MSTQGNGRRVEAEWPRLVLDNWTDTRETLHMWTQNVGRRSTPPGTRCSKRLRRGWRS